MRKVLIANRGEIAVRAARGCRDAGIASVAVYADPDRDALHVRAADEAFALGGATPAASYLDASKILAAAAAAGADALHPGYGVLSEDADFAQSVEAAGLTWIGPSPHTIRLLGDRMSVRAVARRVGAPLVERCPDRPRHVETQCLADVHGHVVVVSTRDCSLQRRHQKLVAEAPAPFLTAEQDDQLRSASKAILRAVAYVGAATCEFLVGADGAMSFLGVDTRLPVEHPVTEEVTGIDLVWEQLRIADGEALGYDDPPVRGHAIEFRIDCEDAERGFLPAPGTVRGFDPPSGPGVRLDSGVRSGCVIGPAWDSLLAKLVVSGADRAQALARSRRALAEFDVAGIATTLPFHRAVVTDPAFTSNPFAVHTRWIETGFATPLPPFDGGSSDTEGPAADRETHVVEVGGRRIEITMDAALAGPGRNHPTAVTRPRRGTARRAAHGRP